ncbi:hypothetical protein EDD29_2184 [Actinocorallia herbida]|uniref:Uncharacterized protein n=1 Tax=Actinocorallia herbida TaxID=58109 RepID=A0A3N1CTL8_9ACTN|nr:hypothetical protein EDD29_2184 [Actinocorallia herbida]
MRGPWVFVLGLLGLLGLFVFWKELPDLKRYLRMRRM